MLAVRGAPAEVALKEGEGAKSGHWEGVGLAKHLPRRFLSFFLYFPLLARHSSWMRGGRGGAGHVGREQSEQPGERATLKHQRQGLQPV